MSIRDKSCRFVCHKWLLFSICFVLIYFDLMLILFGENLARLYDNQPGEQVNQSSHNPTASRNNQDNLNYSLYQDHNLPDNYGWVDYINCVLCVWSCWRLQRELLLYCTLLRIHDTNGCGGDLLINNSTGFLVPDSTLYLCNDDRILLRPTH